jgi:hypothetical protein
MTTKVLAFTPLLLLPLLLLPPVFCACASAAPSPMGVAAVGGGFGGGDGSGDGGGGDGFGDGLGDGGGLGDVDGGGGEGTGGGGDGDGDTDGGGEGGWLTAWKLMVTCAARSTGTLRLLDSCAGVEELMAWAAVEAAAASERTMRTVTTTDPDPRDVMLHALGGRASMAARALMKAGALNVESSPLQ